MRPNVLLVMTCSWVPPARLAMALAAGGCEVDAVAPSGHSITTIRALRRCYTYSGFLSSIRSAITDAEPDFVIPCDDYAAESLHRLHAEDSLAGSGLATLIERSLGNPEYYPVISTRARLLSEAKSLGICVPDTEILPDKQALPRWLATHPLPAYMKADGTSGGVGVRLVETPEQAEEAFDALFSPPGFLRTIKRSLVDKDMRLLAPCLQRLRPVVSAQKVIEGPEANCAVSCLQGRLLGCISAEVVKRDDEYGPATVIHPIDNREMLAAAETISRTHPARGDKLAIVTNALGPGRLAGDAASRAGITLCPFSPEAEARLADVTSTRIVDGLVLVRSASPHEVAEIAAVIGATPDAGGALVILGPEPDGGAGVDAVIAAARATPFPLLACIMGETTGAPLRHRLAEAGVPGFSSPERAVQAFAHLVRERHARAAARELPPRRVIEITPDHRAVAAVIAGARRDGRVALGPAETAAILAAYGFGRAANGQIQVSVTEDPIFGPVFAIERDPLATSAFELPPLNLPLACALLGRTGMEAAPARGRIAESLVRLSQLVIDEPELESLHLTLNTETGAVAECSLTLRPPGAPEAALAITPYPAQLCTPFPASHPEFTIRPIRPEDSAAHIDMIKRIPDEDLRYRFFTPVRDLPVEQMIRMSSIDYDREMAFIAVRDRDGATLGVSRLVRDEAGGGEFAVLVTPEAKGTGLSDALMHALLDWAEAAGVRTVHGLILADNAPMLRFARRLGFSIVPSPDDPEVMEAALTLPRTQGAPVTTQP